MIAGTIYGVALNDRDECVRLADAFAAPPYGKAPLAPIVYVKPRNCLRLGGGSVPFPEEIPELQAAPTVALLFDGEPNRPLAAALAIDVCVPGSNYYRPAIRHQCRDGFLPLGDFLSLDVPGLLRSEIVTSIDGVEAHRWSLGRLVRDIPRLLEDLSFMTLVDGDILLIGLPGDAPRVGPGAMVKCHHPALAPLTARFGWRSRS